MFYIVYYNCDVLKLEVVCGVWIGVWNWIDFFEGDIVEVFFV